MAVNEGDSVEIDIDHLVSSIEKMMPHDLLISSKCCIFKTPSILYRHNEKAYIPDAFSIGPLHHGSPNLKVTEKIKTRYLQRLISRSNSSELLRTLIKSITEVEKDARECYAETIEHYNPEELVKILVLDGCFIIELFRKQAYPELRELRDPIFSRSGMLQFLFHDLILLENQVPWMVLERLFNLTKDSYDEKPLIVLAVNFFDGTHFSKSMPPQDQVINIKGIKHFVDLLRSISIISSTDPRPDQYINIECIQRFVDLFLKLSTLLSTHFRKLTTSSITLFRKVSTLLSAMFGISSIEEERERQRGWEFLPSATSLSEAGIKFKRGTSKTVLEVKFNNGILEIPPFEIHDITETVFRNLISYEQCHFFCGDRITSYAILLDSLINTAKDIDILCKNEIIDNWLNPEDAAQLFNKLYLDTCVAYQYNSLCRQVNSFCRRRWPRWRAVLAHNYFNTPWAFISTLAAFILLVLTLLQTVYTMKN
ncbi:UPF0481 protein At3g47200-like [Corylus avellana]|uniref:UPF0481 protein At3g47200-like n=1 Tax=Corylus avellana TaxID=13451 RepID=UPI001E239E78|nr:UPF0481 protein At3g47200-like [Corylus avellana]XP_059451701.1 UPF0481 protein At3g47200-like [Corylus avellana]